MISEPGKPPALVRTSWWWTQSCETCLRRTNSLVTGKEQGISSQSGPRGEKLCRFLPLYQWLVEQFPATRNRELNHPSRERLSQDQGQAAAGREIIRAVTVHRPFACLFAVRLRARPQSLQNPVSLITGLRQCPMNRPNSGLIMIGTTPIESSGCSSREGSLSTLRRFHGTDRLRSIRAFGILYIGLLDSRGPSLCLHDLSKNCPLTD